MIVDFALDKSKDSKDGKYVLKTGLLFRAGKYEDKDFELTPDELKNAVNDFKPVPLDIEHVPSILDGKLGTLQAVTASEDGSELYGTAMVPKWLAEETAGEPIKVSCTWNRKNKKLEKLALVRNPRVTDAALMAAFTASEVDNGSKTTEEAFKDFLAWFSTQSNFKHQTWEGKDLMQSVHNMCSRAGAVCCEPDTKGEAVMGAEFVSASELKAIQQMHDTSVKNGAKCSTMNRYDNSAYYNTDASSSGDKKSKEKKKMKLSEIKNALLGKLDELDAEVEVTEVKESKFDTAEVEALKKQVAELTATITAQQKAKEEAEAKAAEEFKKEEATANTEADAEKEALKKQIAELQAVALKNEASQFAEELVKDKKIVPAMKPAVIELFSQAKKDDEAGNCTVNFSNGDKAVTTRVEALKVVLFGNAAHNLTAEELSATGVKVIDTENSENTDFAELEAEVTAYAKSRNKAVKK